MPSAVGSRPPALVLPSILPSPLSQRSPASSDTSDAILPGSTKNTTDWRTPSTARDCANRPAGFFARGTSGRSRSKQSVEPSAEALLLNEPVPSSGRSRPKQSVEPSADAHFLNEAVTSGRSRSKPAVDPSAGILLPSELLASGRSRSKQSVEPSGDASRSNDAIQNGRLRPKAEHGIESRRKFRSSPGIVDSSIDCSTLDSRNDCHRSVSWEAPAVSQDAFRRQISDESARSAGMVNCSSSRGVPNAKPLASQLVSAPVKDAWNEHADLIGHAFRAALREDKRKCQLAEFKENIIPLDSSDDDDDNVQAQELPCALASERRRMSPGRVWKRKTVERLKEGVKIYDLYAWKEVLQESGDGGKVVTCWEKAAPPNAFVMKLKTNASLGVCSERPMRFKSRMEAVMNLPAHPNLVRVHNVFEDSLSFYTLMTHVNGGSLLQALLRCYPSGSLPPKTLLQVIQDVLFGLQHLHSFGLLHRDVKPDNVVVDLVLGVGNPTYGKAMLCDFDHTSFVSDVDMGTEIYGTPCFCAPEVFCAKHMLQSDLYGVGVILYLLVSGMLPYCRRMFEAADGEEQTKIWRQRVYDDMRRAGIQWDLSVWNKDSQQLAFCKWMLNFDLERRPRNAQQAFLHPWIEGQSLCEGAFDRNALFVS